MNFYSMSDAIRKRHGHTAMAPRARLTLVVMIVVLAGALPREAASQWAANPGETLRNGFGPTKSLKAPMCRGACGMDCPSSCDREVRFECAGGSKLLRVNSYSCGTHQGCREHDDCLDRCAQEHEAGYDCSTECHAEAVNDWGLEQAGLWAAGSGPFDDKPIEFQYTIDQPGGPEAFYRCPEGARVQCTSDRASCLAGSESVEPVFDTFAGGGPGTIGVSGFHSGRVCLAGGEPSSVCQASVDIQVTGEDQCVQSDGPQRCTWYGFELDYRNANTAEPLVCRSSADKEDFLGSMVSRAIEARPVEPEKKPGAEEDLGSLLGKLQQGLNSGKSLDQVFSGITVTTADGRTLGKPAETFQAAGVPAEIVLNSTSGHLLVPIFELHGTSPPGSSVEHLVRCFQGGHPVIETTFRLHFTDG